MTRTIQINENNGLKFHYFGGGIAYCSCIEIPNIIITDNITIQKPLVLILDNPKINVNIIGQDILKQFSYYLDNKKQTIYFL